MQKVFCENGVLTIRGCYSWGPEMEPQAHPKTHDRRSPTGPHSGAETLAVVSVGSDARTVTVRCVTD